MKKQFILGVSLAAIGALALAAAVSAHPAGHRHKHKSKAATHTNSYTPNFSAQRFSNDVREVSSDAYEGRGVGTRAEAKTIDFMSRKLASAGFAPGGPNGKWTQEVLLRKFEVLNPSLSLKVGNQNVPLKESEDITISSRGALGKTEFNNAPLVFVGYGISAPERNWNDFKGPDGKDIDVRGKVIVVLINDADYYAPENNTFGGKAMTYYGRWTYKFEEAARRGALGCIIVHDTGPASYGWETVKNSNRRDKLDIVRADPSKASPKLESWVSGNMARFMFKAAGLDFDVLSKAAQGRDFRPVELSGVTLNGGFDMKTETITSYNVIGILRGSQRPNEQVLYTAHWDHIGIGAANAEGDNIFNGALDNGTGLASMIEIARNFGRGPRPQRSVVMIGFTAEESGLLGSEYYAANPVYPLETTAAGINMDGINIFGRTKDVSVGGFGQSSLDDILGHHAIGQNRTLTPDKKPEAGYYFRSDHFPLVKRGVPMLSAGSGMNMVNGGEAAGIAANEAYTKDKYHQQNDEWSADWKLDGAVEDMQLYYKVGHEIANSRSWPHWRSNSEFKAARDSSNSRRSR